MEGVEPTHPYGYQILSLARLPIPPHRRTGKFCHSFAPMQCLYLLVLGSKVHQTKVHKVFEKRSGTLGLHSARVPSGQLLLVPISAHRSMSRDFGLEISQADPLRAVVEIDLSNGNGAPILGLGDRLAAMVEHRRDHPVVRDILIGAADEVYVILTGPGASQQRVASPNRPGDHLRTVNG